jgi:hypothetical protein
MAGFSADLTRSISLCAPLLLQEPTQDDYDRETSYVLAEDLNQTLNQVRAYVIHMYCTELRAPPQAECFCGTPLMPPPITVCDRNPTL